MKQNVFHRSCFNRLKLSVYVIALISLSKNGSDIYSKVSTFQEFLQLHRMDWKMPPCLARSREGCREGTGDDDLTWYLGRHSLGSGCAGIHGYNRVPNCRCPSSTIQRPGYSDRHPVPVPPSEAEDVRSAGAGKVFLERNPPRFELATTFLSPVGWRLRVNDLANDFAGRTSRSMPEPTKSTLKKHRRQSSKVESMTKCDTRDTILTTAS